MKIFLANQLENYTFTELEKLGSKMIYDMGWHLCYFGGEEFILSKLRDFSHSSMKEAREIKTNPEILRQRIQNKEDVFGRKHENLFYRDTLEKIPVHSKFLLEKKNRHLFSSRRF